MSASCSTGLPRPHDLLWIDGEQALVADEGLPSWLSRCFVDAPVVVARRAPVNGDLIPVGVRGRSREERYAASVPAGSIVMRVAPEDLVARHRRPSAHRLEAIPALRAFIHLVRRCEGLNVMWGPAGAVGFELATGVPAATDISDLDLVIRPAERFTEVEGRALLATFDGADVVVDVQVEGPAGSFSLREYCDGRSPKRRLKTRCGPRLVSDPWEIERG